MLTARYTLTITLNEEEANQLDKLKKKGVKVIDVFRCGLDKLSKKVS